MKFEEKVMCEINKQILKEKESMGEFETMPVLTFSTAVPFCFTFLPGL